MDDALTPATCKLCRFVLETAGDASVTDPADVQPDPLGEDEHWIVALNENQAVLGRVYFVLKRHETDVAALSEAEQSSLWWWVSKTTRALGVVLQPDHFNYMFLMNVVGHSHFHIYPRYRTARTFAGVDFDDPNWGGHYDPAANRRLDESVQRALASAITKELKMLK